MAAYGNVTLRPFGDLDILVPRDRLADVQALLAADGYRPLVRLSPAREARYHRTHYDLPFRREPDGTVVEVHWALAPRYFAPPPDFAALHRRRETVDVLGHAVPTLAADDLIPALCDHGARHLWERLEWVAAVAALVRRRPGIDWDALRRKAAATGAERRLLAGLWLAEALLAPGLPGAVAPGAPGHPGLQAVVAAFRRRLERGDAGSPGLVDAVRWQLALRERLRDRVRYCIGGAFSPSERDGTGWPSGRPAALLPLLRPVRLLREYGLRRAPSDPAR